MPARWGVMWRNAKTGNWTIKSTDDDFSAAQELLVKLIQAGRKGVSIRSLNVAFPPPSRITAFEEVTVTRNPRTKKKRTVTTIINLMEQFNQEGAWWCPYCIKVRKFIQEERGRRILMVCPACGISSNDGMVKKYNPYALMLEVRQPIRRISERSRRRRIRRST